MKSVLLLFASLALAVAGRAAFGQNEYAVSKINPEYIENADAVVRFDEMVWEIQSKSEAKYRRHLAVTILNEAGEEAHSVLQVYYGKFCKITDISGALYNSEGKVLKKLKNADILDFNAGLGSDEIIDTRARIASFGKKSYSYPYTVEYIYETRDRNMMSFPGWAPASNRNTAIEHAVFKVVSPAGIGFRFKEYNSAPVAIKTTLPNGSEVAQWTIDNRPAEKRSEYLPLPLADRAPLVVTAPTEFEIQDYQGNFATWEDLSTFYYNLNAGRDVLPAATLAEIRDLTRNAKTDREKIELIYKWMQKRSRYVSIQLGIGGWQTIDAATVAAKGYGDCKALTNFTLAALKSVGVTGYAALILSGRERKIRPDFPSNQFNHVVACALAEKDTIWLECTSQTTKPNYMGAFTGDRHALLVMPKGGKLVATHTYSSSENVRNSRALINLAETGVGTIDWQVRFAGLEQETRNEILHNTNKEEQKKWLMNSINLPSLDLQHFELSEEIGSEPAIRQKLTLNVRNCATKTGTRLFVKPTLLSRTFELPTTTERTTDFYLPVSEYNFTDLDTVYYTVPDNFKLETALPAMQLSSTFGTYELNAKLENNTLTCVRRVVINGGRYSSKDFSDWVDFLKKIRKADRMQVVFVENK